MALLASVIQRARRAHPLITLGIVMGVLAAISLLLASLGVYGLVADTARQREREMAVRLALGAKPSTIISLLLGQARRSGVAGAVLGLGLAIGVARALRSSLIAVRVFEPMMFLSAVGILLTVVMIAAYVPARRASRTDPAVLLRQE